MVATNYLLTGMILQVVEIPIESYPSPRGEINTIDFLDLKGGHLEGRTKVPTYKATPPHRKALLEDIRETLIGSIYIYIFVYIYKCINVFYMKKHICIFTNSFGILITILCVCIYKYKHI